MDNKDSLRSRVDTFILQALAEDDRYGFDILKDINDKCKGAFAIKQPTLYSCLKRLESKDYIRSYLGEQSNGGQRRYYALTDKGRDFLKQDQLEWEFSRTIIDKLLSDREFDFENDKAPFESSELKPLTKRDRPKLNIADDDFNVDNSDNYINNNDEQITPYYAPTSNPNETFPITEPPKQNNDEVRVMGDNSLQENSNIGVAPSQLNNTQAQSPNFNNDVPPINNDNLTRAQDISNQYDANQTFANFNPNNSNNVLNSNNTQNTQFESQNIPQSFNQAPINPSQLGQQAHTYQTINGFPAPELNHNTFNNYQYNPYQNNQPYQNNSFYQPVFNNPNNPNPYQPQMQSQPNMMWQYQNQNLSNNFVDNTNENINVQNQDHFNPQIQFNNAFQNNNPQSSRNETVDLRGLKDIFGSPESKKNDIQNEFDSNNQIVNQQSISEPSKKKRKTLAEVFSKENIEKYYAKKAPKNEEDSNKSLNTDQLDYEQHDSMKSELEQFYDTSDVKYRPALDEIFSVKQTQKIQQPKSMDLSLEQGPRYYEDYNYVMPYNNNISQAVELSMNELKNDLADEGYRLRPYNRANSSLTYYSKSFVYHNKLRLQSALLLYLFIAIELLITYFATNSILNLGFNVYLISAAIFFAIPLIALTRFLLNPRLKKASNRFQFKTALINSIMLYLISIIIIIMAGVFIFNTNISDKRDMLLTIGLPCIFMLNLPVYVIIYGLLFNTKKFHIK